jgi:hypothetical protein
MEAGPLGRPPRYAPTSYAVCLAVGIARREPTMQMPKASPSRLYWAQIGTTNRHPRVGSRADVTCACSL